MTAPTTLPLLILAPLRIEARALRRGAGAARVRVTGMGPEAAARATQGLRQLPAEGPVAVAGFGGALRPEIRAGEVVVATEVRGPGGVLQLPSAPAIAQALRLAGLIVHLGPVVSIDHVVYGKERSRLASGGALAVDMESYWLVADRCAVPCAVPGDHLTCVVRVILDSPRKSTARLSTAASLPKAYRSLVAVGSALGTWAAALGPREVQVASPRSFCTGVNRAIESTEEALEQFGPPVYVLHEIVHNKHVVDSFRERGVVFVPYISDVPEGETVIFSAHGVGQAERHQAESRHLRVVDATCPLVARVHAKAKFHARRGRHIVLIGKKGHDEVEGVMGEVPEHIHLVEGPTDIESLDLDGRRDIAVLTQTTLIPHEVEDLIRALKDRFPEVVVSTALDVCYASQNRQEAVRRMSPQCDLVLVLGSRNSSNSKRLVEEASRLGTPARLVDDESEVDLAWLASVRTLGLTAGASAPESLLERMIDFMGTLGPVEIHEQLSGLEDDGLLSKRRPRLWASR